MRLAIISYLPAPGPKFNTEFYLRNLTQNPPKNPLILFSDHKWPQIPDLIQIGPPDKIGIDTDGEKRFSINNLIFFTSCRIADKMGFTHFLYGEADMRVKGAGWDEVIFDEFFSATNAPMFGGSMVCYNPCNGGPEGAKRWGELIGRRNKKKNMPIPTYGFKSAADNTGSAVFVNGAGGIYSVAGIKSLFTPEEWENTVNTAQISTAWDMELGLRLWKQYGVASYDLVAHLDTIYSSYGDVLTTLDDRLRMLNSGAVKLVHQVKAPIS